MPVGATDYEIHFINLDRDVVRRQRMEDWYAGYELSRFPGIYGADLAPAVLKMLTRATSQLGAGTLGCFLSHVGVWDLVARGDASYGLVLEDDAKPFGPLPASVAELQLPADCELLFVNRRAVPGRRSEQGQPREYLDIHSALAQRPPGQGGFGADGYFISKSGAERLLRAVAHDRPMQHLDIQLVAYAFMRGHAQVGEGDFPASVARISGKRTSSEVLKTYVMHPPLVNQHDDDTSTRRLGDAAALA